MKTINIEIKKDAKDAQDYIAHKIVIGLNGLEMFKSDKEWARKVIFFPFEIENPLTDEQFEVEYKKEIQRMIEFIDHYKRVFFQKDIVTDYEVFNPLEFHKEMCSYDPLDKTDFMGIFAFHKKMYEFLSENNGNNETQTSEETKN